jgi:hypothetical protein
MSGSFLTGPPREANQGDKQGDFLLSPFEGLVHCPPRFGSLYIRGAGRGEGQKKRQSLTALPLLKSFVFKTCLELPPGHAGQANQAQAEKQHRHRFRSRLQFDRGLNPEIGFRRVPLCEEEIESIRTAFGESERSKIHFAIRSRVNSAEIEDQLLVDENPNIVITGKTEGLPRLVGKLCMNFVSEVIIVRRLGSGVIAEKLSVDREESAAFVNVGASAKLVRWHES